MNKAPLLLSTLLMVAGAGALGATPPGFDVAAARQRIDAILDRD